MDTAVPTMNVVADFAVMAATLFLAAMIGLMIAMRARNRLHTPYVQLLTMLAASLICVGVRHGIAVSGAGPTAVAVCDFVKAFVVIATAARIGMSLHALSTAATPSSLEEEVNRLRSLASHLGGVTRKPGCENECGLADAASALRQVADALKGSHGEGRSTLE